MPKTTMMTKSTPARSRSARPLPAAAASLVLLLGAAGTSGSAWAQLTNDLMAVRGDLSQSQSLLINEHVSRYAGDLQSESAAAVRQGREELVRPLERSTTSRDFRVAYSGVLVPELRSILNSDESAVPAKINALIVLGKLASDDALESLRPQLQSELDALRYTAAMAHRLTFDQMRREMHIFNPASAMPTVSESLRDAFAAERQPVVMHAQIQAMAAIPEPAMAIETITNGIERQIADLHENGDRGHENSTLEPGARAMRIREGLDAAMRRYTDLIGVNPTIRRQQQRELAITSAAILVMATEQATNDGIVEEARPHYDALVRTSENILNVVTGQTAESKRVSESFAAGGFAEAERALNGFWLNDTGPLYGDPVRDISPADIEQALDAGN